jgi:hypothetical protein
MTGRAGYIYGEEFLKDCMHAYQFKREKKYDLAIDLFLKIIDEFETESMTTGCGVPPGYYEEMAIIYRKLKLIEKEKQILVRFSNQKHGTGGVSLKLYERLGILNAKYPDL